LIAEKVNLTTNTLSKEVLATKFVEEPVNLDPTEAMKKHIGKEIFLFSCNIVKYNKFGWRDKRSFIVT